MAYFSIFDKKIQKIVKILKFQMNLKHPIFNIFWHLTRRWTFERPYFTNSEKNNFFQTVAKNIFEKKQFKFLLRSPHFLYTCQQRFFSKNFSFFWVIFRLYVDDFVPSFLLNRTFLYLKTFPWGIDLQKKKREKKQQK